MTMEWKRIAGGGIEMYGKGQLIKGKFHATSAGYGFALDPNRTWVERGNADDGGAVMTGTGAAYLYGSRRLLLTAVQTGNNSYFGGCDRLSVASDCSGVTAEMAGGWSMLEMKSGGKTNSITAAHRFDLKINSGSTVSAGVTSALLVAAEAISPSTTTGSVAVLHVPNPQAGTYGEFAVFGDTTGCTIATFTGNSNFVPNNKGTFTQCGQLKILIGSSTYYIPYGTVA
jgi:hypothetical protein